MRCARPSLASSPERGKPPRQLTALGGLPNRLTRRLLLRSGSRSIPPTSALRLDSAPPPLRKTAETGTRQVAPPPPASASPVLAPETLASSLASAAAWSCAGPQVRLASGRCRPTRPFLLPPQPDRPEARTARPRAPRRWTCTPRRESGQLLLRLRFSCVRGWASAELAALTAAPTLVSPLALRAPR